MDADGNPYDVDGDAMAFENMNNTANLHDLKLKEEYKGANNFAVAAHVFDHGRRMSDADSDAAYGISKEIFNFQSAP